jgi:hypothetical protein
MMIRGMAAAALLALAGAGVSAAGAGSVVWEKPEAAQARSAATGMPICYFFTQNGALKEGGS